MHQLARLVCSRNQRLGIERPLEDGDKVFGVGENPDAKQKQTPTQDWLHVDVFPAISPELIKLKVQVIRQP